MTKEEKEIEALNHQIDGIILEMNFIERKLGSAFRNASSQKEEAENNKWLSLFERTSGLIHKRELLKQST